VDNIENIMKYSKNLKLLYVEDNKEARESTVLVLEEFFDNIIIAIDGKDGYDKFQENKIDVIITDINMPRLNGLEMTAKIKELDSDIPILILSAYNESEFFMDSIKIGIEGYLLKPIDIEQFMSVLSKVTQRLKLAEEAENNLHFLKEYEEITNRSSIVSKTDLKGIITFANDKFCQISEYTKEELIGENHNIVRHPDMPKEAFADMWNTIKNKKEVWQGVVRNLSKSGKSYYVEATVKPILDKHNNILEYIALRNDIGDIMNPKKQLLDAIKNSKEPLVIYLKLEDFASLEDLYGSDSIEEIQDIVKDYLEENLPKECKFEKVYQLGNGEYVVVYEKTLCIKEKDKFISQLRLFQEKTKKHIINFYNIEYNMMMMISLAYEGEQVLESSKLGIKKLLKTKQDFIISNNFAKIEQKKAKENIETILMIKKAINNLKIVSYFQPIINNKTQKVEKYESLVRLIGEDDEVLAPFFFLDVAKRGRYYSQITTIVLNNSFNTLKNIDTDITINLSALDIESEDTRKMIFKLLEENSENASRVVVELLEDENIKKFDTIDTFIQDIKRLGVKIAIDDFGAGYSNFERLLCYQPDILKIDGCLIRDIETNDYSLSVVKTIVDFAKRQGIKTVAEFVENEQIFNILKDLGVDYSQGYYFGKPEPLSYYSQIKDNK